MVSTWSASLHRSQVILAGLYWIPVLPPGSFSQVLAPRVCGIQYREIERERGGLWEGEKRRGKDSQGRVTQQGSGQRGKAESRWFVKVSVHGLMVHITAQWEFNSDEGGSQLDNSSSLVIQIFTFMSNNPVWLLTKWYLFHSCTETARNSPKTTWIFSMFPCRRAIRGITSVTSYVSHCLPMWPTGKAHKAFWQWTGHVRSVFNYNDASAKSN